MKIQKHFFAVITACLLSCTSQPTSDPLPSWNDTDVKQRIVNFITSEVETIPVADRIAVFDMDGTLVCEKPFGIETVVSVHRLLDMGKTDSSIRETKEYQFAQKLAINPRDTSVLNHVYEDGQNYLSNIIMKPFEGADCEEYITYANHCLNNAKHPDHGLTYSDMFYQPMLELIEQLKAKQFQIYIVSASMQGIVWSICPQELGLDRDHLIGIRHAKNVQFNSDGTVRYTIHAKMLQPVNDYHGKAINIFDHIGKLPVLACGNAYSDFGMFHLASCSKYPNLALLIYHDDAAREYEYAPYSGKDLNWQDTVKHYNWVQANISKEFRTIWKKK